MIKKDISYDLIETYTVKAKKFIDKFYCALVGKILLQGRLMITDNYVCFFSYFNDETVFGSTPTEIIIPLEQIFLVNKRKFLTFLDNSLLIQTKDSRNYEFTSFLNRDTAYRLINQKRKAELNKIADKSNFLNNKIINQIDDFIRMNEQFQCESDFFINLKLLINDSNLSHRTQKTQIYNLINEQLVNGQQKTQYIDKNHDIVLEIETDIDTILKNFPFIESDEQKSNVKDVFMQHYLEKCGAININITPFCIRKRSSGFISDRNLTYNLTPDQPLLRKFTGTGWLMDIIEYQEGIYNEKEKLFEIKTLCHMKGVPYLDSLKFKSIYMFKQYNKYVIFTARYEIGWEKFIFFKSIIETNCKKQWLRNLIYFKSALSNISTVRNRKFIDNEIISTRNCEDFFYSLLIDDQKSNDSSTSTRSTKTLIRQPVSLSHTFRRRNTARSAFQTNKSNTLVHKIYFLILKITFLFILFRKIVLYLTIN